MGDLQVMQLLAEPIGGLDKLRDLPVVHFDEGSLDSVVEAALQKPLQDCHLGALDIHLQERHRPIWVRKTPRKEAEEMAMHFLERVRIPAQAGKYTGQLSGGQPQRVANDRSLCMTPGHMLFEEPNSAPEPDMTQEAMEAL